MDPLEKSIVRRSATDGHRLNAAGFSPVLARIFAARGVVDERELDYRLGRLHRPELKGLEAAVDILAAAIYQQQKILIIGDFDVDGATSTALMVRCLNAFGAGCVEYLVPNRFEFGYGLTPEIVEVAAQRSPSLLVTVDNGISSVEGVERAKELGMKVVITDHHLPGASIPDADAIVNPNQRGCEFPSKNAAGVGVVFYVMLAVRAKLRLDDWFGPQRAEPNLAHYLDLVALGTVADVVPLDRNNRIFVARGLERITGGASCVGIRAILQVAGRSVENIQAMDLGFVVGPRLNAAGRLDDMSIGIQCLLADDLGEAMTLAAELDSLNRERRSIEASMQEDAAKSLELMLSDCEDLLQLPLGICFYQQDWHQGVIGILASRLKDRLHRPVLVFANDGETHLKGSGRSVPGVHLRDVLDRVAKKAPDILCKFGGHAMAAGLTIQQSDLPRFKPLFAQAVEEVLDGQPLVSVLETDGELMPEDFHLPLAEELNRAGPWGQGFPEPNFDGEFILLQQKIVGVKHLKMVLAPVSNPQCVIDAIAFNVDLNTWPDTTIDHIRAVYKLSINEFRGKRSLQLLVEYLRPIARGT